MGRGRESQQEQQDEERAQQPLQSNGPHHAGGSDSDAARPPSGKSNALCRRIPVPLAALAILVAAVLGLIIAVIILAVKPKDTRDCPHCPDFSASPLPHHCSNGWISFRRKCWFFSKDIDDWNKTQSFCASQNSSLAYIETQQELNFCLEKINNRAHWIGLRKEQGHPWKWTDGSEFNNLFNISQESGCAYLSVAKASSSKCTMSRNWICTK